MVGTGPILRRGVLLQRRTHTWSAQPKCRNKGKAVIVRIGSINPLNLRGASNGPFVGWSRKLVSILALVASVAALALIVESQYGQFLFGESWQRPFISQASADTQRKQQPVALTPVEEARYRALSEYVAKRYRVSQEVAFNLVSVAHQAGEELKVDPLLIIAVIAVESGPPDPPRPAPLGDHGVAEARLADRSGPIRYRAEHRLEPSSIAAPIEDVHREPIPADVGVNEADPLRVVGVDGSRSPFASPPNHRSSDRRRPACG